MATKKAPATERLVVAEWKVAPELQASLEEIGSRLAKAEAAALAAVAELRRVEAQIDQSFPVGFSRLVREQRLAQAGAVQIVDEAAPAAP